MTKQQQRDHKVESNRRQRRALYDRIDQLDALGIGPTRIAATLHIGRRTVYNRRAQQKAAA